jgi:hypothetical protein
MAIGFSGVSNFANTTTGYANNVNASNLATSAGLYVGGGGVACTFIRGDFIILEPVSPTQYLLQETGSFGSNLFKLETSS